ncbi:MAG: WbuC family cupin fold metalloprotein [Muribaculaceae bacterium]|nr:WbuC family cupin fold metalloprotein [Muribaculaceae bacterium]
MKIDRRLLDTVLAQAAESPRLRMNYNFHESLDSKAQRLLNALLPGTVLPVHRHRFTSETYVLLQGKMKVTFYDDNGKKIEEFLLDVTTGDYGLQIPRGVWHGIDVIEPTVIFEVKDGPYTPLTPDDILSK